MPATVAELQRVGLFASLPGEALSRLAEETERLAIPSGSSFGSSAEAIDVLLTGLARGGDGLLRPGGVSPEMATAITTCVVARCNRVTLEGILRP